MKPSVLIKSDPFFSDHEVGWLIRNNITRWAGFARFSVNEIFEWTISDGSNRSRLHFCHKIVMGCRERGMELKFDKAFEMLSRNVRQKLAEFEIFDIVALAGLTCSELRDFIRNAGSRQDCIILLEMVGLSSKPEMCDVYLNAEKVSERLKRGDRPEAVRVELGLTISKFNKIVEKIADL